MFHLAANFVALANTANTDVPALNDDILLRQNSHHVPNFDTPLMAVYSSAVTLLRTRLNSPKVRQIAPSFIVPVGTALLPPTNPSVADYRQRPFVLKRLEEITYESTDSAVGPNNHYILSWLDWGFRPAPIGDVYGFRGTSTTAAVASTWTTIDMTWDSTLPEGEYAVIGGQYIATNAVAFQCIFYDQYPRPGALGQAAAGNLPWRPQLDGGLGMWGKFSTINLPRIRVLNDSTDNSHIIILQVVRIR